MTNEFTHGSQLPKADSEAIQEYLGRAAAFLDQGTDISADLDALLGDAAVNEPAASLAYGMSMHMLSEYMANQDGFTLRDWSRAPRNRFKPN